jgi:hypothetical protein
VSSPIAAAVAPRWKATPCDSCSARMAAPSSGPSTLSSGCAWRPTTCTSSPHLRWRRRRNDRAAVRQGAKVVDVRATGTRNVEAHRIGSRREQQSVERDWGTVIKR